MTPIFNVGARSRFVTVTAWIFIAIAVLAAASVLLQTASLASLAPSLQLAPRRLPWPAGWLMAHLGALLAGGLALALALLVSAVGLLQRLEWARRAFIALMAVMIAAHLGSLWLQQVLMLSLVDATLGSTPLPPSAADLFGGFVTAARSMAVVVTLAVCGLFGWIIRRLMSPAVRQEFA